MKRLLVVLFGVLVFQGSVWAECPDAKVLSPGANSVLIKDLPVVLQWQDDDLCLGKRVTIDLVGGKSGKTSRIAYMNNRRDYKVKHPNSGFLNIDRLIAPVGLVGKWRFKISSAQKAQGQESIESEPIVVRLSNSFQKKGGALGSRSHASIPYQIGDLLTRIAALEATVKALEEGGVTASVGEVLPADDVGGPVLWASLSREEKAIKTACWDKSVADSAGDGLGWVVGSNRYAEDQEDLRNYATLQWSPREVWDARATVTSDRRGGLGGWWLVLCVSD